VLVMIKSTYAWMMNISLSASIWSNMDRRVKNQIEYRSQFCTNDACAHLHHILFGDKEIASYVILPDASHGANMVERAKLDSHHSAEPSRSWFRVSCIAMLQATKRRCSSFS
jgi:hypothetical protein